MSPKQHLGVFLPVLVYLAIDIFLLAEGTSFIRFDCELLPVEDCAFAVGYSGRRCVLETSVGFDGSMIRHCQTSDIDWRSEYSRRELRSIRSAGHLESDQCIDACGLHRITVGISTDGLQTGAFQEKICSDECQHNCPEVMNLYRIIYAEEGQELTRVCEELLEWKRSERERVRRIIAEAVSSPAPAPAVHEQDS